jgi:hypothetical protein
MLNGQGTLVLEFEQAVGFGASGVAVAAALTSGVHATINCT